jgi:endonuclease III
MQRRAAEWIRDRLAETYGAPQGPSRSPLETLVETILSQNTNDANRDRAYASLLRRFGGLDRVADAKETEIAAAIRVAGLQAQKARAIHDVLQRTRRETGRLDLDFLARRTPDEAFAWLRQSRGVGDKTASIVLLFSFGYPFLPVDTHVGRVLRRLGAIPASGDAFRHANAAFPRDAALLLDLHLLLIELGRTLCRPRRPACSSCPLRRRCEHGRSAAVTP